jgi:DNA topoisomerase-3
VTRDLVERIKKGDIPEEAYATVEAPCPKCGGVIQENYRKFQCQNCDFSLWVVLSGREWAPEEVGELVTRRFVGPLTGFRSRAGKPFSAGIRLAADYKLEFDFGQARLEEEAQNPPDFSGQESVGACPKCGARVFEYGTVYVCEKAVGPARSCEFRSGKMILHQAVERGQMQKLLATGRTDLLTQFVSRKGRRFKAYLVKTPEGKVGFEFEARAPRRPSRAAAAAPATPARAESAPPAERASRSRAKPTAKAGARAAASRARPAKRKPA